VATLLLAAIGIAGLRDRWLRWLVAGVIAYQVAVHIPVLYSHRYSVGALDLWLTLLAAVGLAHLWQRRRTREIAAASAALAIGIAAAGHQVKNGGMPEPDVFAAPHVLLWESRAPVSEIDVTSELGFSDWFNHVLVIDSAPCGALRLDYPDGRQWTRPMETDGTPHVHQVGMLAPRAQLSMDCPPGRTWTINRIAVYSARGGLALREQLDGAPAALRTAQAPELSVVLGLAVVRRQFRSGPDVPERVELRPILRAADVGVRRARMVDVAETPPRVGRIERVLLELDDRHDALALRTSARLREPDHLALEFPDLRSRGDSRARE
jgi:hypothetical protein